jgi:Membrane-associated phospholipid phosphatase
MVDTAGNIFYFEWELKLMEWLQSFFGEQLGTIIGYLSFLGEEVLFVLIIGFFYWGIDKEMGVYLGRNVLLGTTWNPMVKNVFFRRRPYFDDPKLKILRIIDKEGDPYSTVMQGFSFPSAHSTASVAIYGAFPLYKGSTADRYIKLKRFFTVMAILFPLLVGFSRVIVGAHYPTDVMVGWLLGLLIIFFIPKIYDKIGNDALFSAIIIAVSLPGFFYCRSNDYFSCFGLLSGFLIGTTLEKKYVNFENTSSVPVVISRIVGGLGIFVVLLLLAKLPFSDEFLHADSLGSHAYRVFRYGIIAFVVFFVYPMVFRFERKRDIKDRQTA